MRRSTAAVERVRPSFASITTSEPCQANDYQPSNAVDAGLEKRISTCGRRPTDSNLPYFNVQKAPDEGMIVVLSWPGNGRRSSRETRKTTSALPGAGADALQTLAREEVRSPMIVLQFWKGDRLHGKMFGDNGCWLTIRRGLAESPLLR